MILTQELLRATSPCLDGYKFGLQSGMIGGDYDAAVAYCRANGQGEYAQWMEQQRDKIETWRLAGKTVTANQYRFFNYVSGQWDVFASEQEASSAMAVSTAAYAQLKKPLFSVVQETLNENGDATWVPVDIDSFEGDGVFNVFDPQSGQHIRVADKSAAIAKRDELLSLMCAATPFVVEVNYIDENGVVSSDWEPLTT